MSRSCARHVNKKRKPNASRQDRAQPRPDDLLWLPTEPGPLSRKRFSRWSFFADSIQCGQQCLRSNLGRRVQGHPHEAAAFPFIICG